MSILGIWNPFRKGEVSFPMQVKDNELIKQSVENIIMTGLGERVMRPTFGSNTMKYIFENNDDLLRAKVREETIRALETNETRIKLTVVDVSTSEDKVFVNVEYSVKGKYEKTKMVFNR
jgi:hypothetical protein